MAALFVALLLLSFAGLALGLLAPHSLSRLTRSSKPPSRAHVGLIFGFCILVFFILTGVFAPAQPLKADKVAQTGPRSSSRPSATARHSTTAHASPSKKAPVVTTRQVSVTEQVPFTTEERDDSGLSKGQTRIVQTGVDGSRTLTYKITFSNGKQVGKTLLSTTITARPIDKIVELGTYVAPRPKPTAGAAPPPAAPAPSCYPLTSGGNCYEPGEYCRDSDHGASGVAGDGKSIVCSDNDGWRWEPR